MAKKAPKEETYFSIWVMTSARYLGYCGMWFMGMQGCLLAMDTMEDPQNIEYEYSVTEEGSEPSIRKWQSEVAQNRTDVLSSSAPMPPPLADHGRYLSPPPDTDNLSEYFEDARARIRYLASDISYSDEDIMDVVAYTMKNIAEKFYQDDDDTELYTHQKTGQVYDKLPTALQYILDQNGDDCDGLMLLSRQLLIDAGFDKDLLYYAILEDKDPKRSRHAVVLYAPSGDFSDPYIIDSTNVFQRAVKVSELKYYRVTEAFNENEALDIRHHFSTSRATNRIARFLKGSP